MLKTALGDEAASKIFSTTYALKHFLGWDDDENITIAMNTLISDD